MKRFVLLLASVLLTSSLATAEDKLSGSDQLVVHEWGTFTSLQDEDGNAIGSINTDDEPVPSFVHRLAYNIVLNSNTAVSRIASKGIFACHPDATMRLETPVVYFHPPEGWKPRPVDVRVLFHGGWLTEYYPDALFRALGFTGSDPKQVYSNDPRIVNTQESGILGHITKETVGELSWKGLTLGDQGAGPSTEEKVWLAPRGVNASPLGTAGGEHEKFLFYRGVGHVDSPLRVARNGDQLEVSDNPRDPAPANAQQDLRIHAAWLVEVKPGGGCAFRTLGALECGASTRATMPAEFSESDFQSDNLSRLKSQMHSALVSEGLFADEADALLNTWDISYFKSPGMRFFYLCPRADVESILPLEVSVPSRINRAMIGRIEMVTPDQRALLKKIATSVNILGANLPDRFPEYLELGRFRNALILNEEKRHPSAALRGFIADNRLSPYPVPPEREVVPPFPPVD